MDEIIVVELKIPTTAMQMIEAAAHAYGWTPKLVTPDGEIDNPKTALERILEVSLRQVKENASAILASRRAEEVRQQVSDELEQVLADWMAVLNQ